MQSKTVTLMGLFCCLGQAQNKVLNAVFAPVAIEVDGKVEEAWSKAAPAAIAICMNPQRTAQLNDCKVSGTVQALWNGPLLYLLFRVTDLDINTAAPQENRRSGVQVYVDQYDDKFPKFEEDDGYVTVSAAGQQTGNRTNAGLPYFPAVWSSHLHSYAAQLRTDASGGRIGYDVEIAWSIGDRPLRNGTKLGMEFVVNAVGSGSNAAAYQLYWSSGNNKGTNDNTMWGDVVLTGYDGVSPMPKNTFLLEQNIHKAQPAASSANGLVRGIWTNEAAVDRALAAAETALQKAGTQRENDAANAALEGAAGIAPRWQVSRSVRSSGGQESSRSVYVSRRQQGAVGGRLGEAARGNPGARGVLRVR